MQDRGISAAVGLSPMAQPPAPTYSKYERLIQKAKEVPAATTIVVHPCDETFGIGAFLNPREIAAAQHLL